MNARTSRTRSLGQRIRSMTDAFGGIAACAAAAEAGKRPPRAALEAAGIAPDAFDDVKFG
ncbi:hypothetical protein D3218_14340 [Aureimonas flava]|uniref:Uncharacterized protein n=1 Tax=Aureimonas flava TaxID=2320271 RepID=A0A3A1WQ29_9HYPH|nr:hypothetical protein [Aureimonas flava]RIX99641.1 hypothetical protein D3218_14340 [Aureimonas flava]